MAKIKFLLAFLFVAQIRSAQAVSHLKIVTNCNDVIILLDTTHVRQAALIKIEPGNYVLKCWAPNHEMTIDTLKITGDTTLYFKKKLQYTEKYKVYKKQVDIYKSYLIGTSAYIVGSVTGHFLLNGMMHNAYEKALVNKAAYENSISPEKIYENRQSYERDKDRYEALRISDNTLKVVSVGLIAFGIYQTIHQKKKLDKVSYHETPVLVDMGINSFGDNQLMAKIIWKF